MSLASHSKTSHTMKTSKSESTIPDFNQIHANYSKALIRGRHPNSFPKESELWYHFRSSSERVKKASFGVDLWEVVEEHESMHADDEGTQKVTISEESKQGSVILPTTHANAIQMRTINGVQIDMKSQVPIHFGMVFIIMNMMDEVLCVNKWDEVKCKPIQNIDPTDKICFKILHLGDPTNPGVVKYGSPMWLQVLDSTPDADNSWQNSYVLAAKPFGPPEMGSMELDRVWGASGGAGSKDKDKAPESVVLPKIGSSSSKVSLEAGSEGGEAPRGDGTNEAEADAKVGDDNRAASYVSNRSAKVDNETLAAVIGDLQPCRIVDAKRETSDALISGPRNHSKASWYMGQWVGRLATRSKLKSDVIFTQAPIYMEQDLYCLASSHGTGFKPWPRNSSEIEYREANFPKLVHIGAGSSRSTTFENMNRMMGLVKPSTGSDRLVGGGGGSGPSGGSAGGAGPGSVGGASSTGGQSGSAGGTGDAGKQSNRDIGEYGCVRKVSIRGPPYKNLVDRRCVWKFCAVDTQGDMQSLSVKDQITQRLMNRARVELRKSEQNRKGICIHKGYEYRGQPLTRGEGFTRTLRAIILQNTHNLEVTDMKKRREKEAHLRHHFADMMFGDDKDAVASFCSSRKERHDDDDSTVGTFVSQLSDDHFSPYKERINGVEVWDESMIKEIVYGGDKSKGGSRNGRPSVTAGKPSGSRSRGGDQKHPSAAASGDEDESISSGMAAKMLEQAFHVDKFTPSYLPKKPMAYTAPVYSTDGSRATSAVAPDSAAGKKKKHSKDATAANTDGDDNEETDISQMDFASALSYELEELAQHHTLPANVHNHMHSLHHHTEAPTEGVPQHSHHRASHPVIHVPLHPMMTGMQTHTHHGTHHPAAARHSPSDARSRGGGGGSPTGHQGDSVSATSKDGSRQLSMDHHIDLFQSDGERVVTIHDMMDYLSAKAAHDVAQGDGGESLNGSMAVSAVSQSLSTNNGPSSAMKRTTKLAPPAALAPQIRGEVAPVISASIAAKIAKLQSQDQELEKVLKHRESLEQYKRITQLFQDIKTSPLK